MKKKKHKIGENQSINFEKKQNMREETRMNRIIKSNSYSFHSYH